MVSAPPPLEKNPIVTTSAKWLFAAYGDRSTDPLGLALVEKLFVADIAANEFSNTTGDPVDFTDAPRRAAKAARIRSSVRP
ncbi:hypothetical protein AWB94_31265 [Mycolicibacterium canariasense]|nr:hypothetical protein AWB94_31265 [Mycolicibacterium canariasense]